MVNYDYNQCLLALLFTYCWGYQGVRRTPDYSIIARVTYFEGFILGQQSSSLPVSSLKIEYKILVGLAVLELLIKICKLLF